MSVQHWFAFRTRWPNFGPLVSSGHKMIENAGFRPLFQKVFTQSISNLCKLIGWVFRIDQLYNHIGQILVLYWPQKMAENGGLRPLSEKAPLCGLIISGSISNMVYTVVRGVFTNDSFLPHRPNLASLYFHSLWLDLSRGRASSDTLFSYI